jgi:hypothetical protein
MPRPSSAFTLRFHNPDTHRLLRLTAEAMNRSMNEIAEEAVSEYLAHESRALEERLRETADLLREWRGEGVEAVVRAFASGEIEHEDPLRARRAELGEATADPLDIGSLFARSVE